jgi:hypothetical protein
MSGPLKQRFARFTGIADIRKDAGSGRATIVGGADVYVSDFGDIRLVPHPYAFSRAVLIADPSMAEVAMLDGYKTEDLAKTGDSEAMADLFGGIVGAMASGILMIYFVLVMLFHSFFKPITILSALPLTMLGAFEIDEDEPNVLTTTIYVSPHEVG